MADIDHFKSINDTFGHDQGDVVLKRVAQVLKGACRVEDIVARYGGEEFVVLLGETDSTGAEMVAQRIHDSLAAAQVLPERPITISMGLAAAPPCTASGVCEIIKFADQALYQAKDAGRNRTMVFHPATA